ncbi:hypothetical protein LCGC14_1407670, partial [marine sediment metagenome]
MKPILFSGEMVKAMLEGRKTQTRRIVKPQPERVNDAFDGTWDWKGHLYDDLTLAMILKDNCPYGQVGDRLWVRETFSSDIYHSSGSTLYRADGRDCYTEYGTDREHKIRWKPSIHMPRWASRITLEITGVKVERIQDISLLDCEEEGVTNPDFPARLLD